MIVDQDVYVKQTIETENGTRSFALQTGAPSTTFFSTEFSCLISFLHCKGEIGPIIYSAEENDS